MLVGEIAEQIRGVTYNKDEAQATSAQGLTPILRANNISDTGISLDGLVYVPDRRISIKQRLIRGDVVVATSSGSLSVVGKAAPLLENFEGSFGAFCKVLRPNRKLADPSYFSHFFRTKHYRQIVSGLAAGANINNLKNEHLDELEIPIPPLDEQRRIAAILDKAEALRRQRKRALDLLNELTQSQFVREFSAENCYMPLGDLLEEIDSGWSPICLDRAAVDNESGTLKLSAITQGAFKPSENKAFPSSIIPRARHEVMQGDILFCRKNTRDLVGASAYVWETPPRLFISDLIFRLVPKLAIIDPIYLQFAISSPEIRHEISALSAGSAGSMPNISKSKLREISIPLPDLGRQRKFSAFAGMLNKQRQQQIAGDTALGTQLASLRHRAFTGQL